MAAAGIAFGGLAAFPASAADVPPPRVTAASALQPVALPAPQEPSTEQANVTLSSALEQGLAVANKPEPTPPPLEKASRSRTSEEEAEPATEKLFVRPGAGRLTSPYGRRWGRLHAGIDLAAGMGSPIRAVTNATVLSAGTESGYGRVVRLVHSDGTVTVYAHMSSILVSKGERVSAGQQVGREGNTGRSTGPHLHFEVRVNGTPVNPVTWLRKRGVAV
jgi:murein DD-endopeptidase MepM/ murein hydrolase activator NlpD